MVNRYGQPFMSAIDYNIYYFFKHVSKEVINDNGVLIETGRFSSKTDTSKLCHKIPTKKDLLDNIRVLRTWGLLVNIDQDMVIGKDGALICLVDKKYTSIEQLSLESEFVRNLLEQGYELKIGEGVEQKSLGLGYDDIDTNVFLKKEEGVSASTNGLYCTNFKKFYVPDDMLRYSHNANILRAIASIKRTDKNNYYQESKLNFKK